MVISKDSIWSRIEKIDEKGFGSCFIYSLKSGAVEKRHYHDGIEILYILNGSCKTHKEGKIYFYKKGQIHRMINDSKNEISFVCLQIPAESDENTVYVEH